MANTYCFLYKNKKIHMKNTDQPDPTRPATRLTQPKPNPTRPARFAMSRSNLSLFLLVLTKSKTIYTTQNSSLHAILFLFYKISPFRSSENQEKKLRERVTRPKAPMAKREVQVPQ